MGWVTWLDQYCGAPPIQRRNRAALDGQTNCVILPYPMGAKKPPQTIGLEEVKAHLASQASDFSFEVSVLQRVGAADFEWLDHSGTYVDPVTNKRRQFDIRACRQQGPYHLCLAIEAKNLRDSKPLLIYAVRRRPEESFHEVVVVDSPVPRIVRITGEESGYVPGEFVGKKMTQPTIPVTQDSRGSDSEVWERFSQAMSSARDLIEKAESHQSDRAVYAILPVVVVPDGRLWQADYDTNGLMIGEPKQVSSATYYMDYGWRTERRPDFPEYVMSHLEITTFSHFRNRARDLLEGGKAGLFRVREALFSRQQKGRS